MNIFVVRKDTLIYFALSILVALIVGNRGATNDTQIYYDVFRNIDNLPLLNPSRFYAETGMEIGYGWVSYIVHFFSTSNVAIFTVISFLTFVFIIRSAQELNIKLIYPFFIYLTSSYFFMQQLMQIRQALAVAVVTYGFILILKYGIKPFSIIIIIAGCFFHQSAIALACFSIFFYILRNIKIISAKHLIKTYWILFASSTIFFKFILMRFLIGMSSRLQGYESNDTYSYEISLFSLPNLRTFLIMLVLSYFSSFTLKNNIFFKYFLFLIFIAMAMRIGFSDFAILSGRLSNALSYVEVFALSMLLIDRFNLAPRLVILTIYCILQLLVVFVFQAPYLTETYFDPLYLY